MGKSRPYCLTIGGFDPSGGAGVIADCKVFEQHKVNGLAILTCNTIQVEDKFVTANWVSKAEIIEQLTMILARYKIKSVKIGLIENGEILLSLLKLVKSTNPSICWDPVLTASGGGNLENNRFNNELPEILKQINLITPNTIEYDYLLKNVEIPETLNILLKGGHSVDLGRDILIQGKNKQTGKKSEHSFKNKARKATPKHGSGCLLSAAIAANIALEYPLVKNIRKAKDYVTRCLESNETLLAYHV